jgi:hypothetical protein
MFVALLAFLLVEGSAWADGGAGGASDGAGGTGGTAASPAGASGTPSCIAGDGGGGGGGVSQVTGVGGAGGGVLDGAIEPTIAWLEAKGLADARRYVFGRNWWTNS